MIIWGLDEDELDFFFTSPQTPGLFHTFKLPLQALVRLVVKDVPPSASLSCLLKDSLPPLLWHNALNVKPWRYLPSHRLLCKPCKLTVCCTDAAMAEYIDFTEFFIFLSRSNADFLLPKYRHICTSICLCMFCTSALTHKTWTCPSVGADGNTLTSHTPSMGHTTHAGVRKDSFWSWFIPLSFF